MQCNISDEYNAAKALLWGGGGGGPAPRCADVPPPVRSAKFFTHTMH